MIRLIARERQRVDGLRLQDEDSGKHDPQAAEIDVQPASDEERDPRSKREEEGRANESDERHSTS